MPFRCSIYVSRRSWYYLFVSFEQDIVDLTKKVDNVALSAAGAGGAAAPAAIAPSKPKVSASAPGVTAAASAPASTAPVEAKTELPTTEEERQQVLKRLGRKLRQVDELAESLKTSGKAPNADEQAKLNRKAQLVAEIDSIQKLKLPAS